MMLKRILTESWEIVSDVDGYRCANCGALLDVYDDGFICPECNGEGL
jgi:hypothetical protein